MYSYHLSVLSFSLILIRVSISLPGFSTAELFYFSAYWEGDSAPSKPFFSIRMFCETSPGISLSFSILEELVRLQDVMHQVIKSPFLVPPAWKKVYAATTVCFSLHCFFLFICVVFLPQCLNLCNWQYCLTHLPAASRKGINAWHWWLLVCKAKLWFYLTQFYSFCSVLYDWH